MSPLVKTSLGMVHVYKANFCDLVEPEKREVAMTCNSENFLYLWLIKVFNTGASLILFIFYLITYKQWNQHFIGFIFNFDI